MATEPPESLLDRVASKGKAAGQGNKANNEADERKDAREIGVPRHLRLRCCDLFDIADVEQCEFSTLQWSNNKSSS